VYRNLGLTLVLFVQIAVQSASGQEGPVQINVQVPKSRLILPSENLDIPSTALELQAGSLNHIKLDAAKWAPDAPDFKPTTPLVGMNYLNRKGSDTWLFGIGFAKFERRANFATDVQILSEEQQAYMIRARAGYRREFWQNRLANLYVAGSILPTVAVINQTSVGSGDTLTTFPSQVALGGSIRNFTLEGFLENFNQTGFSAGVRIDL
jgi:hypothetical protein